MVLLQSQPKYRMKLPGNEWRQPFFYIAQDSYFHNFILLCIIVNTATLTLEWYGMAESMSERLEMMNYIFTGVFTTEFLIKYVGFGNRYFKDPWNTFDTVIVMVTLLGILIS